MGSFVKIKLIICLLSLYIGFTVGKDEHSHTICGDYSIKHADWYGWLSIKDGTYRCFWVESNYPYRVKQGVIDVK